MNLSRMVVILILVACIALIAAQGIWEWRGVDLRSMTSSSWGERPQFEEIEAGTSPLARGLAVLLTQFISGTLLLYLFTPQIGGMHAALQARLGRQVRILLLGLVAGALLASLIFSAAMAVTTFPLSFLIAGALFAITYIGFVAVAYALGERLLGLAGWAHHSPVFALLAGLLLVHGAGSIPYLGIAVKIIAGGFGLGVTIATRFGTGKRWSLSVLTQE